MSRKLYIGIFFIFLLAVCQSVFAADKPLDPDHAYNQGVDFYNKLDYNKAADSFLQSLNTQNKHLEQWSAYNLGSAFFGQGHAAEKKDPGAANQVYKKALDFFKQAIDIDPADKDAKYNYELTAKKIIEQDQKSKQDKKNKQDQQDKKDKQDKQNQQSQQGKQQEQQNKQGQEGQQDKQEEPDKQNQQSQQDKQQEEKDKQAQQSTQQNEQRGQMTKEEAKMLLENFQQSEAKQKELNLYKAQQQQPAPGVKDW
jgi:Ca-activated chloride channel homolog